MVSIEIEDWYAAGGREQYGEQVHERLLQAEVGDRTLARMHKGRWQHGCLYIKHIFVRVTGTAAGCSATVEVALLDLEKCRQRLTALSGGFHDMLQLRRHSSWSDTRLAQTQLLLRNGVWQRYQGFTR
jgi:hypothetical protein